MIKMDINGWFETDRDSLQHCKRLGKGKYGFIQANWLDTAGDDPRAENAADASDNYAVCADTVDLSEYDDEQKETVVSMYGHTVKGLIETYGEEGAGQIIAECIFEESQSDGNCISGVVSRTDAELIIRKYMEDH